MEAEVTHIEAVYYIKPPCQTDGSSEAHHYLYLIPARSADARWEMVRHAGRQTSNPRLEFDWTDAAKVISMIRELGLQD